MSTQHASTTLAKKYQTSQVIWMIFPKEVDMDRPLRVTFGKGLPYAPTLTELIHRRCHRTVHCSQYPYQRLAQIRHTCRALKARTECNDIINART